MQLRTDRDATNESRRISGLFLLAESHRPSPSTSSSVSASHLPTSTPSRHAQFQSPLFFEMGRAAGGEQWWSNSTQCHVNNPTTNYWFGGVTAEWCKHKRRSGNCHDGIGPLHGLRLRSINHGKCGHQVPCWRRMKTSQRQFLHGNKKDFSYHWLICHL